MLNRRFLLLLLVLSALALLGLGAWFVTVPLWAQHHLRAAEAALGRLDFAEARDPSDRCLAISPEDPAAHLLAAQAARRAGALEDAERHLRAAGHSADVNQDGLLLEYALLTAQRGDLGEVEAPLRRRLQGDPPE